MARSPNHDPQQNAVYDWEDSFTKWAGPHLTKKQARAVIEAACRKYRIPIPKISFFRNDGGPSSYYPSEHAIRLRPRHLSTPVALHESAHAITDSLLGSSLPPHGAEFLGIYMVLLEDFGISPKVSLHASADAAKLKYRTRAIVGPKSIRKRNRSRFKRAKQERKDWQ